MKPISPLSQLTTAISDTNVYCVFCGKLYNMSKYVPDYTEFFVSTKTAFDLFKTAKIL